MNLMKKIAFILLTVSSANLFAGGVLDIYSIQIPGKKIIMLNEQHNGHYKGWGIETLAGYQTFLFKEFFEKYLAPIKQNCALYLEAADSLCEDLVSFQDEKGTNVIFDNAPSFFDQFISSYARGARNDPAVDVLANYDGRDADDIAIIQHAIKFMGLIEFCKENSHNQAAINQEIANFVASQEYAYFIHYFDDWYKSIDQRLVEKRIQLQKYLNNEQIQIMRNQARERIDDFEGIRQLKKNADSCQKSIMDILLELLAQNPADFRRIVEAKKWFNPGKTFYDCFEIAQLITELTMLEKILEDKHPCILVYGGKGHNVYVTNMLLHMFHPDCSFKSIDLTDISLYLDEKSPQKIANSIF